MIQFSEALKGEHPGSYLKYLLDKQERSYGRFALDIGAYPQTLSAIINGKRRMNVGLALKIEKALHLAEGLLMTMQVFYDIEQFKRETSPKPDIQLFRSSLFWDTDPEKLDWIRQKKSIVDRVMKYGNDAEIEALHAFYSSLEESNEA